jgi:hypothetical protein
MPIPVDIMGKFGKQVVVYLDSELADWLSGKSDNGYKKASFIRHLLQEHMEFEKRTRVEA